MSAPARECQPEIKSATNPHLEALWEIRRIANEPGDRRSLIDRIFGLATEAGRIPAPESINHLPRAVLDIANERFRQVEDEGWTPDHDDEYDEGALAQAALCYVYASVFDPGDFPLRYWPWDKEWWKPADNRRNLVKAAALIVAEIERLDRGSMVPLERSGGAT